jgi:hypothetical protein
MTGVEVLAGPRMILTLRRHVFDLAMPFLTPNLIFYGLTVNESLECEMYHLTLFHDMVGKEKEKKSDRVHIMICNATTPFPY